MQTLDHLIERRAEQMAYLLLTQKGNLTVFRPETGDAGLDFLVQIPGRSSQPPQQFGVLVKGRRDLPSLNGHAARSSLEVPGVKPNGSYQRLNLPVCLFLFFMDTDAGYFSWLQEPVLQSQGGLRQDDSPVFQPLTPEALESIVTQIREWHSVGRKAA